MSLSILLKLFPAYQAGEGSDIDPSWKKAAAYKKEKDTHEDEEEEDEQVSVDLCLVFKSHLSRSIAITLHRLMSLFQRTRLKFSTVF